MIFTEMVRKALAAHNRAVMVPGPVPAAVLLPLFQREGRWHVLFTKRTEHLNHHRGEISFPGGVCHPEDETPLATALRETWEEVGLPPEQVEILGILDDAYSIYNYLVTPYVGVFPGTWQLVPNSSEIDRLIEVPLDHLRNPDIFRSQPREWKGHTHMIHFYSCGEDEVWGLTAAILKQFLDLVFPARALDMMTKLNMGTKDGQEGACSTAS